MSAFICSPKHIATCAQAIWHHTETNMLESEIRHLLLRENIVSVCCRYNQGPTGFIKYLGPWLDGIMREPIQRPNLYHELETDPEKLKIVHRIVYEQIGCDNFHDYVKQYDEADPIKYTNAEAVKYLECLGYQSCEYSKWPKSTAYKFIKKTINYLHYCIVKEMIGDRHVWDIN